jgi:hypothetical protein
MPTTTMTTTTLFVCAMVTTMTTPSEMMRTKSEAKDFATHPQDGEGPTRARHFGKTKDNDRT